MNKILGAITGGETTYITPPELLVKSNPYGNPNAKLTRDMCRLVLRSSKRNMTASSTGAYVFDVNWQPSLVPGKRYMVIVEGFASTATLAAPYTISWGVNAINTYDIAGLPGAVLTVGRGNVLLLQQPIGAVYDAFGSVPMGEVSIYTRDVTGAPLDVTEFVLSLVFLPVD
jgi:hypothetical protein